MFLPALLAMVTYGSIYLGEERADKKRLSPEFCAVE